jgi:hypothetical protein
MNAPVSEEFQHNLWIHSIRPASTLFDERKEAYALGAWGNLHLFRGEDWDDLAHELKISMASLLGYALYHER